MEIVSDIINYIADGNSVVTVGTFDGVHIGHQKIIAELKAVAKQTGAKSTLVSFEPHPQLVLSKSDKPGIKILTTKAEKIEVLRSIGLERLVFLEFNQQFAETPPRKFVEKVLINKLKMSHFIIGYDHAFGKNRQGNIDLLKEMSRTHQFDVDAVGPVLENAHLISSTNIRNLLLNGSVVQASEFLGRKYKICGTVVKGYGRGKVLGFPTANIKPLTQNKLIPKEGIYATRLRIEDKEYNSVTYIGNRPTFNLKQKVIEVHVSDGFGDEIYDKKIELLFHSFIRDDARFDTTEELIKQIEIDKKESQRILASNN